MVVELPILIGAVGAVGSLVKETVSVVEAIRSGWRVKNEEAKLQLMKILEDLQSKLQLTGDLAKLAKDYFQAYENVLKLRLLCDRAQLFLSENIDGLRKRSSATYAGNWKVLNTMMQTIDNNREVARKVVMDRAEWYGKDDKDKIELLIQQFTSYYDHAEALVERKVADTLLRNLQDMTTRLLDVETLLRDTIYDEILMSLQKLGR